MWFKSILRHIGSAFLIGLLLSCASVLKEYDHKVMDTKDFDDKVKVTEVAENSSTVDAKVNSDSSTPVKASAKTVIQAKKSKIKKEDEKKEKQSDLAVSKKDKHEPDIEDAEGFIGRRPVVDPFRVGETVSYSVSYFGVEAGIFTMNIKSLVEVNGRKAYFIHYTGKTSSLFEMFYAVDDEAKAYLDYETLVPQSYSLHVKESKQVREVRSYFNLAEMKAYMWDKKQKKGEALEEKKYDWPILPYSQNVFTVAYYMRTFSYKIGKEFAVRVAHEKDNLIMRAKVIREEKIKTDAGTYDAWVIKPQFEVGGIFKPVGDVFIWLSKDDRKIILRIESKIKIGTIVIGAKKITP